MTKLYVIGERGVIGRSLGAPEGIDLPHTEEQQRLFERRFLMDPENPLLVVAAGATAHTKVPDRAEHEVLVDWDRLLRYAGSLGRLVYLSTAALADEPRDATEYIRTKLRFEMLYQAHYRARVVRLGTVLTEGAPVVKALRRKDISVANTAMRPWCFAGDVLRAIWGSRVDGIEYAVRFSCSFADLYEALHGGLPEGCERKYIPPSYKGQPSTWTYSRTLNKEHLALARRVVFGE